jgi:predicted MFS family arabinose efflux permease
VSTVEPATLPSAPVPPVREVPLWRNRDYLLLWGGAGISFLGSRVSAIAYSLLVLWATGSATAAGLVGFAALLPNLVVQLPAGALVDRWDRRTTMIVCDLVRILLISSVTATVLLGHVWIPLLMVVAFSEASLTVVYRLAERAAVRNVVPRSQLSSAMARNEARGQAAGLLGQPAGTLLFSVTRAAPFAGTAIAHLVSLLTLLLIRKDLQGERPDRRQPARIVARVVEGFHFVWGQLYLRRALALIAASNILFQIIGLGLIVIVKHDGGSPAIVGFIIMANGLAGMLGALTAGVAMRRLGVRRIIMVVNVVWAALMPLIAFVHHPVALAAIYSSIIFAASVGNVAGLVYQVKTTPDNMQGRVGSISTLLASGTNSIGALIAGVALDKLGSRGTMLVVAAVMAVLAVLAILAFSGRKAAAAERALDLIM